MPEITGPLVQDMKDHFVLVSDLWNLHWCRTATMNVGRLAGRINQFLHAARDRGALIIHAPSTCMNHYAGTEARERAIAASRHCPIRPDLTAPPDMPISHGPWDGCPDEPRCPGGTPWTQQISTIDIDGTVDAISDDIDEIYGLITGSEIPRRQAIILGVHLNECVLFTRDFSLKTLALLKGAFILDSVRFVRDLTDTMYDPRTSPCINHFAATDLMAQYVVEVFGGQVTSMSSTALLGGDPFKFPDDGRPSIPDAWRNRQVILQCGGNGPLQYLGIDGNTPRLSDYSRATRFNLEEIGPGLCFLHAAGAGYLDGDPDWGKVRVQPRTLGNTGTRWYLHQVPPYSSDGPPYGAWVQCCGRVGPVRFLDGDPNKGNVALQETPIAHAGCRWSILT